MLNPAGFLQRPDHGLVSVSLDVDSRLRLRSPDTDLDRDLPHGVTAQIVASPELVRSVAALGMAGVPVTAEAPDPDAATRLGPDLAAALISPVDLSDPLRREEHSVRLLRSAMLGHSSMAWRARLAARAGLPHRSFPACTIVLATRREDQLALPCAKWRRSRTRGRDARLQS